MSRYRHFAGKESAATATYSRWNKYGSNTTSYPSSKTFDRMWDRVTPDFDTVLRAGELLPVNSMTKRVSTMQFLAGRIDYVDTNQQTQYGGATFGLGLDMLFDLDDTGQNPGGHPIETLIPPPKMIDVSIKEALAAGKRFTFDALTWAAELNRTVQLFMQTFERLLYTGKTLMRKARKYSRSPSEAWKKFSELWLEWRYGWRLLIFDVQNLLDALKKGKFARNRGWAENVEQSSFTVQYHKSGGIEFDASALFEIHHTVRAGSLFEVSIDGLDIGGNSTITSWEKIPFSFVLDWFIDIGTAIIAVTDRPGFTFKHLWVSVDSVVDPSTCVVNLGNLNGNTVLSTTPPLFTGSYRIFSRQPRLPDFLVTLPEFRLNLNWQKLLDLLALGRAMHGLLKSFVGLKSF